MNPIARSPLGTFEGAFAETASERPVEVYRGIRYARAERFAAPRPVPAPAGTVAAHGFGPVAPQRGGMIATLLGGADQKLDEDCLWLNVWTPGADDARRPVLVWIHGGAFTSGSGSALLYDGTQLAARGDVVVVTLNYRLGALGFADLSGRVPDAVANCGLRDQLAALRWVHEAIASFGGDPANVTLFGESAGAMSVGALLASPAARGLFARAILQSGAAHHVSAPGESQALTDALLRALDAPGADLRAIPFEAWIDAQERAMELVGDTRGLSIQPCVDGDLLPTPPLESLAEGLPVDVLIGTNADEYKLYGLTDRSLAGLDRAGLLRRLARNLPGSDPALCERLLEVYTQARSARGQPAEVADLWFAIETDRVFGWPARRLAECAARGERRAWRYRFDWASPALEGRLGACHGLEIAFVFGTLAQKPIDDFTGGGPEALALSRRMQDAWLAFARSGTPANPDSLDWHPELLRVFDRSCRIERDAHAEPQRIWRGILP